MKRTFLLTCLMLCMFAASCYDDEIADLKEKIEALEGTQIASLQQQITAIKNTLPNLEETDGELKTYINSLQNIASNLQKSISETNIKIEELKSALQNEMSTEKADIMMYFTELKTGLETELAKINATIATLQAKDVELEKKIDDLKNYVNTELANNQDWVEATFATLEQYSILATDIETIKSSITTLNSSLESLERRMSETIATEITNALEPIKDELVANILSDIAGSYMQAITDAKEEITTAYTEAIETVVSNLETAMRSWVSNQLKGYYTIAEVEGKLAALMSTVSENDMAIQTEIEELGQSLSKTKQEITKAYSEAIEDAIVESAGIINGSIAIAIAEANVKVEKEIEEINSKIAAIESRLEKIEGDIATIGEQIAGINATIENLKATDAELEEYIKSLQSSAANLQSAINETNSKIREIEEALKSEESEAKEVLAQLAAMRADMESELQQVNATIAALQAKDAELDNKIEELRAYVDTELAKNTNWANATFATLEQFSALASEVATIKAQIEAINSSMAELENRLNEKWTNDLAEATASLDATIQDMVSEITAAYTQTIASVKEEITEAYTAIIAEAISSLENSMMEWVSNKLEAYYTIAEVEGKLAAIMNIISENDNATQAQIEELSKLIENIKQAVAGDFWNAIEDAINENNGRIDGKIAQAVAQINSRIDNEIAEINYKIADIESRLEKMERDIATIGEQIANISCTIEDLRATDAQLEEYINSLRATAAYLQSAINETNSKIFDIEDALETETAKTKAEVLAQLAAVRAEMESELEQINETIAALQAKDAELDRKIEELRNYVEAELANNEDWANATFATLEQYSSLAIEIATIKSSIAAINYSIEDLESRMTETITIEIAKAIAPIKDELVANVISEIADSYLEAIANAKEEITTAYTAAIENAILGLEASMQSWVSDQLKGYYTIAEVEGRLAAILNIVSENDNATQAQIEELAKLVENIKQAVAGDYWAAIEDAINENNGIIDGKIAQAIAQINSRIDNEIAEINEKIAAIESRLDKIERDIATIGEQVANISCTIEDLRATDAQLEEYINSLRASAAGLQSAINETNSKIDEIEEALRSEASAAKAEVLAQLAAMRADMESELQQVNATIAALQAKDAELDNKIEELRAYVDTELAKNTNWANATFATLEQYSALASEVATIKAQIEAINSSMAELENRLNEKWENDLAEATASLDATIQDMVSEITAAYTQTIASVKEEITEAYTAIIAEAISSLENSMMEWVSNKLEAYYTIAEVEGKLAAIMNIISENDNATQAEIEELAKLIENIKQDVAGDYLAAIEEAINENNGTIDGKIAQAIAQANSQIENEIAEINEKIAAIESRLDKVEGDIENIQQEIANLLKRIQSVTYIPKYSDGKATMTMNIGVDEGIAEFDFQISPKDAVADIAANWQSILSIKAVYTQTRAVSFIDLPILSCEADEANGVITITASGENLSDEYYDEKQPASASLYISDGNSSINSDFIDIIPEIPAYCEIRYTTTDDNSISPDTSSFDVNIISNTYENGHGIIKFDGQLREIRSKAFSQMTTLATIKIPESVRILKDRIFYECTALTNTNIPQKVTTIPSYMFYGCSSLKETGLSDRITRIEDYAYGGCSSLTYITISDNTYVGNGAFYNCTGLILTTIGKNVTLTGTSLFGSNTGELIVNCDIPDAVDWRTGTFSGSKFSKVTINGSRIGGSAFKGCTAITELILTENVHHIGDYAFSGCTGLKRTTIEGNITSLGPDAYGAFDDCNGELIINGDIPDGFSSTWGRGLFGVSYFSKVTYGENVTYIGANAFNKSYVREHYFTSPTPPKIYSKSVFTDAQSSSIKIYVPNDYIDNYKTATKWVDLASYIVGYDLE